MAKNMRGFQGNLLEYYFLNIILNANFFNDLKIEYYLRKLMEGAMKYFLKKLLGYEIFRPMLFWDTNFFFKQFVKPSGPPPTYLM